MKPEVLRSKRKKLNISQFALAKAAKVSRFKITQYENEYGELNESEIKSITKTLNKGASGVKNRKK